MSEAYFTKLSDALRAASIHQPALVLDLDRLNANIAAINTDPDAPIFKHCRFGIVEDYRKVVPLLRQKLIALQNSQR